MGATRGFYMLSQIEDGKCAHLEQVFKGNPEYNVYLGELS